MEGILPESKHLLNSAVKNKIEDSFFINSACISSIPAAFPFFAFKTAFRTSVDVIFELNGCWSSTLLLKLSSVSVSKFPPEFNSCSNLLFQ